MSNLAKIVSAFALAAMCATSAMAAEEEGGIPDFYQGGGTWSSLDGVWNGYSGKNFDPPPSWAPGARGPIMWHPDHPQIGNGVDGFDPTPRIGDDTSPLLQPWAQAHMRQIREAIVAGGVPFDPAARCWPAGVPAVVTFANSPWQFLQFPNKVILLYQRGQVARQIYLNEEHSAEPAPMWYGESVGHYEYGSTLVIDTIGLTDKTTVDVFNTPHTESLHVGERYHLYQGGQRIELIFTVDDPETFTTPWSASKTFQRGEGAIGEVLCQVNNDDRFNQGMRPVPFSDTPDF